MTTQQVKHPSFIKSLIMTVANKAAAERFRFTNYFKFRQILSQEMKRLNKINKSDLPIVQAEGTRLGNCCYRLSWECPATGEQHWAEGEMICNELFVELTYDDENNQPAYNVRYYYN